MDNLIIVIFFLGILVVITLTGIFVALTQIVDVLRLGVKSGK